MESRLVREKTPTIAWVMPMYGNIHRLVYESHMACMGNFAKNGVQAYPKFVCITNKMGLASASNAIVKAIQEIGVDYVFWTEMDMLLPSQGPLSLLEHSLEYDIDILSGVYFLRGNGQPCLYRKVLDVPNRFAHTPLLSFPENAIFEVGVPGMGCVLFKSSVFSELSPPWFDDKEGECGQDMYFYTRMRENGIKVHADSSVICGQIDEDEPRIWGMDDYRDWVKKSGSTGFLHTINPTIKLEKPKVELGVWNKNGSDVLEHR